MVLKTEEMMNLIKGEMKNVGGGIDNDYYDSFLRGCNSVAENTFEICERFTDG